jgi:multiple sugar transport system ATP-binding protein
MTTITFDGVTKIYRDGTVAVRDLDLVVQDGELFVLLGASGSGKTTVLRLVAGLEPTSEGRILLDGDDVTDLPPPKRDVAMVFQNLALYPHLSVYENIAFGAQMRRHNRSELGERVRAVAAMLGLSDVLGRRPAALSGGQSQRVALGRAIVREPRAFLMDEPLSSIDERLRMELRAELRRIQRELGITMLYVTHDQSEALTLGDRVGVMRDGILQQAHTPSALYERPDNLFVAGFVGSPPMNLAEATVDRTPGGALAVAMGGHRVRLDGDTLAARPGVADYERRQVVVGVRPSHLREAGPAVPAEARLRVPVAGAEQVGGDTYVRFVMDAPLLLSEDGDGPEEPVPGQPWSAERINLWTARVERPVAVGDVIELAVAPGRIHLFDPRTGISIER